MDHKTETSDTKRMLAGALGTILFHLLLILLLWFAMLRTPIPPFPDAGGGGGGGLGIEVNLGNADNGMGVNEANISFPEFKQPAKEIINPEPVDLKAKTDNQENLITDETTDENATSLNTSKDKKANKTTKPEEPKINPMALFKKTNSDGTTNKAGNQGNPNGNPNSSNYTKGGGTGTGQGTGNGSGVGPGSGSGTGGGSGSGNGTGIGSGNGPGISYALKGRNSKSLPKPDYSSSEQGTVVVKIWVNTNGEVTRVEAGQRGTTTSDRTLWKLAENAAMRSKFSPDANAPEEQTGSITYKFIRLN
ncbi:MAG: energy transducer TonB [Bacteroidetes bacterium]|nr:energy transducer TonB [Bacteroidota bacterium]